MTDPSTYPTFTAYWQGEKIPPQTALYRLEQQGFKERNGDFIHEDGRRLPILAGEKPAPREAREVPKPKKGVKA